MIKQFMGMDVVLPDHELDFAEFLKILEPQVKAQAGRAAWKELESNSISVEVAQIRRWQEKNPGADPLDDRKLVGELRDLYHAMQPGIRKLQFANNLAGELRISKRDIDTILGADATRQRTDNEIPLVGGYGNGRR